MYLAKQIGAIAFSAAVLITLSAPQRAAASFLSKFDETLEAMTGVQEEIMLVPLASNGPLSAPLTFSAQMNPTTTTTASGAIGGTPLFGSGTSTVIDPPGEESEPIDKTYTETDSTDNKPHVKHVVGTRTYTDEPFDPFVIDSFMFGVVTDLTVGGDKILF